MNISTSSSSLFSLASSGSSATTKKTAVKERPVMAESKISHDKNAGTLFSAATPEKNTKKLDSGSLQDGLSRVLLGIGSEEGVDQKELFYAKYDTTEEESPELWATMVEEYATEFEKLETVDLESLRDLHHDLSSNPNLPNSDEGKNTKKMMLHLLYGYVNERSDLLSKSPSPDEITEAVDVDKKLGEFIKLNNSMDTIQTLKTELVQRMIDYSKPVNPVLYSEYPEDSEAPQILPQIDARELEMVDCEVEKGASISHNSQAGLLFNTAKPMPQTISFMGMKMVVKEEDVRDSLCKLFDTTQKDSPELIQDILNNYVEAYDDVESMDIEKIKEMRDHILSEPSLLINSQGRKARESVLTEIGKLTSMRQKALESLPAPEDLDKFSLSLDGLKVLHAAYLLNREAEASYDEAKVVIQQNKPAPAGMYS